MTRPTNDDDELRAFLRRHDPVAPQHPATLAALSERILAKLETLPERFAFAGPPVPWILSRELAARTAWALSIVFIVFGFAAGRGFVDKPYQPADQEILASADGAYLQSFISNTASGVSDDSGE